jgi:hypothetical protein
MAATVAAGSWTTSIGKTGWRALAAFVIAGFFVYAGYAKIFLPIT